MKYEIKGNPFPVVICSLEPNESVCCQKGGMSLMSPNMQMETNAGGGIITVTCKSFALIRVCYIL